MDLSKNVQYIKGVGEARAKTLNMALQSMDSRVGIES